MTAIDVASGAIVAKHETKYPMLGGILTTGGDLVFWGAGSRIVALDARTGAPIAGANSLNCCSTAFCPPSSNAWTTTAL